MARILVFSTAYLPHAGGAEIAIQEITARLGEHQFDLVCARYDKALPKREVMGAVTVHRMGPGIRIVDKLLVPFAGAAFALRGRYDLYWAMMVTYGSLGAYIAAWFTKTPIVLTLQEGDPPAYLRRKWFGLVALSWWFALSQSTAVTAISTYLAELAKEFGYEDEPAVIPNGVDLELFGRVAPVQHAGTVLITTSRLVRKNAVDDVIRALPLLPNEVSFAVYGTGPDERKLRALARSLGVGERVRFMGQAAYRELPGALAQADIFIRPSRSEGMGNSFIEAMAAGVPVIATQEGGIKDFLFDALRNPDREATGYAVDKDAPSQIAQAVLRVEADATGRERTIANARALVRERYQWDAIARSMGEVFARASTP